MNKSGKIKFCILILSLLLIAVAAVGCGKDSHTHTYSDEWVFDAQAHWHPSACSHDTKANKSEHTYTSSVVPPTATSAGYTLHICACGYSYASDPTDSLPIESQGLRYNQNGHWKPILSGGQIAVEPHAYTDTTVAPTCSAYGYTKHTCKCGYWYASDAVDPVAHAYDDNVWGHDQNTHWHPALCCDAKSGVTAHNYKEKVTPATCDTDGYTEFVCTDCGYTYQGRTTPQGHTYAATLTGDEYAHWRAAVCGHSPQKTDVADHALVGRSNVCQVCNIAVTPRLAYELSANQEYYIVTGIGCLDSGEVAIPDTFRSKPVQEVAERAFKDGDVTSVTFGANLKKIGTEAFAGTRITAVEFPSTIEEIGTKAFAGTDITAVTLESSIQKIGNAAFRDCKSLQTVQIEGNLTVLAPYTFEDCVNLTSVTCRSKLTEVGAQAFSNCAKLTTIDLSACTKIGFAAFGGCTSLVPVLSQNLAVAEEYAFSGCAVQTVTLPATLTQIGDHLFSDCAKLTSVTLSATSIGKSAFENCVLLGSVTLNNVVRINDAAFKGCTSLSTLSLPDTVARVGENAFTGTGLIVVEGGVKYAANVVVGVSAGQSEVTVKAGTVGIADGAFTGSADLRTVHLGDVRFIGVSAFAKCEKLTAVTFPSSVKYIGANAFRESGLTSVTVPSTVLSVGDNAFYDCKSLVSAEVHAAEIGRFAFSYTGVNRTLSSPVKQRPEYAKLRTLVLGEGVTVIGSNAFQYCPITAVTLPQSLSTIGKYAFAQTDLGSVTVPASVTCIGEYAFYESKIDSATFSDTQNWKAGKTSLTLGTASQNATYLKNTYKDIDWIKG